MFYNYRPHLPGRSGRCGSRSSPPWLKTAKGSVSLHEAVLAADARLDGKFVLTTNTDLPADQVALTYKSLWRVERPQGQSLSPGRKIIENPYVMTYGG